MGKRRIWVLKCTETGTQTPDGEMKGWNPGLREPLRWIAGCMCFTNKECHKQTNSSVSWPWKRGNLGPCNKLGLSNRGREQKNDPEEKN